MTFHCHTNFSDGRDTMEAMVFRGRELHWPRMGITDHGPYAGIEGNMEASKLDGYFDTIASLNERYSGSPQVLAGLEVEWDEAAPGQGLSLIGDPRLDYWIGSMHVFMADGRIWPIDGALPMVRQTLRDLCGGKGRVFAERYYRGLRTMVETLAPPILGHLDLLKKHDANLRTLDQGAGWYQGLVDLVLDAVEDAGTVIEVNTGGWARGYIQEPYPSWDILRRIQRRHLPIQLNSDSHSVDTLDFAYEGVRAGLLELGFTSQRIPCFGGGWDEVAL